MVWPMKSGSAMHAAAARPHDQRAALQQQVLAGLRLQLAPDLVRTAGQRRIGCALAHPDPGDAGLAVAGPLVVRRRVTIDADRLHPAPCELVQRRRARRPQADHDHVPSLHASVFMCSVWTIAPERTR